MGCFDYTCECINNGRNTCYHTGQQYQDANVIIQIPLNDGTNVHIKGYYEEYGYVSVKLNDVYYEFYLKEFEQYFKGWVCDKYEKERSKYFLATKCWTYREEDNGEGCKIRRECFKGQPNKFTSEMLSKCIRIDKDMNLPSDKERLVEEIKELEAKIQRTQELLESKKLLLKEECQL